MSVSPAGYPSVGDGSGRRGDRRSLLGGAPERSAAGGDRLHIAYALRLGCEMLGSVLVRCDRELLHRKRRRWFISIGQPQPCERTPAELKALVRARERATRADVLVMLEPCSRHSEVTETLKAIGRRGLTSALCVVRWLDLRSVCGARSDQRGQRPVRIRPRPSRGISPGWSEPATAPNAAASLDISLYNKPSLTLHCRLAVCTPKSSLCFKNLHDQRNASTLEA